MGMSDNRSRVWFALFVLAVFCVGLATGVLLGRRMIGPPDGAPGVFAGGPLPGPPGGRRGGPPPGILLERLSRDLSLSEDQRSRISVVLKASRERLDQFQQETRDRFESRWLTAPITVDGSPVDWPGPLAPFNDQPLSMAASNDGDSLYLVLTASEPA